MAQSKQRRTCIVPGCRSEGRNKLGARCRVARRPVGARKGKMGALWLRVLKACSSATMTFLYEPDGSGQTTVRVIGAPTALGRDGDEADGRLLL